MTPGKARPDGTGKTGEWPPAPTDDEEDAEVTESTTTGKGDTPLFATVKAASAACKRLMRLLC